MRTGNVMFILRSLVLISLLSPYSFLQSSCNVFSKSQSHIVRALGSTFIYVSARSCGDLSFLLDVRFRKTFVIGVLGLKASELYVNISSSPVCT